MTHHHHRQEEGTERKVWRLIPRKDFWDCYNDLCMFCTFQQYKGLVWHGLDIHPIEEFLTCRSVTIHSGFQQEKVWTSPLRFLLSWVSVHQLYQCLEWVVQGIESRLVFDTFSYVWPFELLYWHQCTLCITLHVVHHLMSVW